MKNFAMQKKIKITTFLMFTITAMLLSTSGYSQEFKVLELSKNVLERETTTATNLKEIKSLISEMFPTMYILKGKISSYGEASPVRIETDIQGIKSISENSSKLGNVKIAKIKLSSSSDLSSKINTDDFNALGMLKYIYVVANFEANESQIASMFVNNNPEIIVLFSGSGK